jgi:hypothetical protein
VQRDDSVLTLSQSRRGTWLTATAVLTDEDSGAGLEGRTIHFLVDGVEAATAVTDSSGTATATYKVKKKQTATATFDGDDSYSPSSA